MSKKQSLLAMFPLLLAILCQGCSFSSVSSSSFEKIMLDSEYYGVSSDKCLIVISDVDEINALVDEKASFGIYVHLAGCTSCAEFEPIITKTLSNLKVAFYSIEVSVLKTKANPVKDVFGYAPCPMIFSKGSFVCKLDPTSDADEPFFKTESAFSDWLSDKITLS
jgi:hypothetical protein